MISSQGIRLLFLGLLPFVAAAAFAQEAIPWVGSTGLQETVEQIMSRESGASSDRPLRKGWKPKRIKPDRRALPQNPASPAAAVWPLRTQEWIPPVESPQTPGISFTGATLSGTNPTFSFPPDVMGDVGPSQYIVAVNGRIVTFRKTTGTADGVLNADMDVFFNSVRNGSGTSDPRIRYDRFTGRWFVVIINVAATNNRILFAVSNTAVITGSTVWTYFYLQHNLVAPAGNANQFADYPTLGLDVNALYVGLNMFTDVGSFSNTTALVIRKSSLTAVGPIVATAFRNLLSGGTGPYTPQGVDNLDAGATQGYLIGVDNATFGTLMLRRITDPGGSPTISANIAITVPATSYPQNVRHLGNTGGGNGYLSAIDDRLFHAVIRNGRLWTAHNIHVNNTGTASGTTTRNGARWYEIQNLGGTPSVAQAGTVYTATGTNTVDERNYWIPSLMVSGQGHVAMGFSTAGTNERANAATVGRLAGDPAGTMQTPVLYTSSTTAYNPSNDPGDPSFGRRWGDYSYTSVDPNDDMTLWTAQQFCNTSNSYGVRIVQLLAPPPATPVSATPPTVPTGQPSVAVTITGTQVAGSGFFDPGAGFPNRMTASLSGGVTVNSLNWVNPTTVTLDLNTTGATAGPRNVTITNPDGQSRVGTGILTVASASAAVTVTIPNGGESWPVGSPRTIQWSSANLPGNVRIDLSTDAGGTFATIIASTTNDGSENWTVAGAATGMARIRIAGIDSAGAVDTSNSDFAIVQPVITLTEPVGGEVWHVGAVRAIRWNSEHVPGDVAIILSRDGGTSFPDTLFAATPNDSQQVCTVTGPPTTAARLRVTALSVLAHDTSDMNFTIVQPALTILAPNGGETVLADSLVTLQWSSADLPGQVNVTLSRNGGLTFAETLFSAIANDGSEVWTVTGPATALARLRVGSTDLAGLADTSDGDFTIGVRSVTLLSPNGSDTLLVDSTTTIRWNSSFLAGPVMLELSRDGGSTFEIITPSTLDDGIEPWVPQAPSSTAALLRVSAATDSSLSDLSDGPFTLFHEIVLPAFEGWNLLSVPVAVADANRASLFPTATSPAFTFGPTGYTPRDTLEGGVGYWMKFGGDEALRIRGGTRPSDTITVAAGWNLIGPPTYPVLVDSVGQLPPGILASAFYGFAGGGYAAAAVLEPMHAYWIKSSANGQLILPGSGQPFRTVNRPRTRAISR